MKILFAMHHAYLPQVYGGVQTSTHPLCRSLIRRGHEVAVLSGFVRSGVVGFTSRLKMRFNQQLAGCKVSRDVWFGYPVWRAWFPWEVVRDVVKVEKPDLAVIAGGSMCVAMALAAKSAGIPVLMHLTDVGFAMHGHGFHGGEFATLSDLPFVANSHFTATKYRQFYGIRATVIYPFIPLDNYRTETSRQNVTFINPVPEKGSEIALEIARLLPEVPFLFIRGWPLSAEQRRHLGARIASSGNLKLHRSYKDMRKVYRRCKILLVPSTGEEAYGMVATEAQVSGIPVAASTRGGLPEAVGPGGVLLDPDGPIDDWVNAIRKLWCDDKYYNELSDAARTHAQRPEIQLCNQLSSYEKVFAACAR